MFKGKKENVVLRTEFKPLLLAFISKYFYLQEPCRKIPCPDMHYYSMYAWRNRLCTHIRSNKEKFR